MISKPEIQRWLGRVVSPSLGLLVAVFSLQSWAASAAVPALEVASRPDGRIELRWPAGNAVQLETTFALGNGTFWSDAAELPQSVGDRTLVIVERSEVTRFFRLREAATALLAVGVSSPGDGEDGVAVTRETVFRLTGALAADTVLTTNSVYALAGGRRLLSRVQLGTDRRTVTLFYLENLPASSRVEVSFDGTGIFDEANRPVDLDGDGVAGGRAVVRFTTLTTGALADTGVEGRVLASERRADGSDQPLEGVIITVDGEEETLRAVTDTNGFFRLQPSPAGRFFVHVDGRSARGSRWPDGAYYPFIGKAWEAVPGRTNQPAGGTGTIYLPLVQADALQRVSETVETRVSFAPSVLATNPALAGVEVSVPANALFADNGNRGGRVGIAPVPPDRLPEPLPPGLNLPLVITIQTDGAMNFDQPVPVRFPNLPDPETGVKAPPGTQLALWSFNHDTGRWEMQGPATVTADGNFVVSDPGVGVRQPGWHGVGPGCGGCGPNCHGAPKCPTCPPPDPPPDPKCERSLVPFCKDKPCFKESLLLFNSASDAIVDLVNTIHGGSGSEATDCIGGAVLSGLRAARDCMVDLEPCGDISEEAVYGNPISDGAIGSVLGCIPDVGSYLGFAWTAKSVALNLNAMRKCVAANTPHRSLAAPGGAIGTPDDAGLAILDEVVALLDRQIEVSLAASNTVAALLGPPWAVAEAPLELPVYRTFFSALASRMTTNSVGGVAVTAAERESLLAVPRPNGATVADLDALIGRLARMQAFQFGKGKPGGDAAIAALGTWEQVVQERTAEGWDRLDHGLLRALEILSSLVEPPVGSTGTAALPRGVPESRAALASIGGEPEGTEQPAFPAGSHFFALVNHRTRFVQRGRLSASGQFAPIVLPPNSWFSVHYFDPRTGRVGAAQFATGNSGANARIPAAPLWPSRSADRDLDGLPDDAEGILGTDPRNPDTDGDGIWDGAEIAAGSDPSDGQPLALGIVAIRKPAGGAAGVVTVGDQAIVESSNGNLTVFDLSDPLSPIERSGGNFAHASLAAGGTRVALGVTGGLRLLSITADGGFEDLGVVPTGRDFPPVAAAGRYFVTAGQTANTPTMTLVDLDDVAVAQQIPFVPAGRSAGRIAMMGDIAWVLTGAGSLAHLQAYRLVGTGLVPLGSVEIGVLTESQLAVGPDRVYVADRRGLRIVDGSNPAAPVVVTPVNGTATTFASLASNGGSLLMAGIAAQFSVFDLTADRTTNLLFALPVPASVGGVAVHRGYGLVAARGGGLNTVHFIAPDRAGIPPSLTLRAHVSSPPSVQESGRLFLAAATVTDDVQVRDVEFFVDDLPAARAGGFPFQVALRAPTVSVTKTKFTVRARATDTGGNATWSEPIELSLGPDRTAPRLLRVTPANNSVNSRGSLSRLTAVFDSAVSESSLAAAWTLKEAGPDARMGTADDRDVTGRQVRFDAASRTGFLEFGAPLVSGTYRATVAATVVDASGLAMSAPVTWNFSVPAAGIVGVEPISGEVLPPGTLSSVTLAFDEVLDRGSVTPGSFQMLGVGADNRLGTADDAVEPGASVQFSANLRRAALVFDTPLANGAYRVRLLPTVRDVYGGEVKTNLTATFTVKGPTEWAVDRGGAWEGGTNWNTGARPLARDYVVIDRPAGEFPITLSSDATVTRLRSTEPFTLVGRVLTVLDSATFEVPLAMTTGARVEGNLVELGAGLLLTSGTGDRTLRAREVRNAGLVWWKTGGLAFGGGTRFRNLPGGEFRIDKAGPPADLVRLGGAEGGNEPAFLNEGLFRKTGGTERIAVESLNLDNVGRIAVEVGALELSGFITNRGGIDVAGGTTLVLRRPALGEFSSFSQGPEGRLAGPGRVEFRTRSLVDGTYDNAGVTRVETGFATYEVRFRQAARFGTLQSMSPLLLEQGATVGAGGFELRDTLGGAGTVRVEGPSLLVKPRLEGGIVFQPVGGLTISNSLVLGNTARWENSGSVRIPGGLGLLVEDDAVAENLPGAVIELVDGASLQTRRDLTNQTARILNRGRVVKAATPGTTTVSAAWEDEGELRIEGGTLFLQPAPSARFSGGIEVTAGASFSMQGGLTTLTPGSRVSGAGEVRWSSRVTSPVQPPLVADILGAFEPGQFAVSNAIVRLAGGGSLPRVEIARLGTLEIGGDLVVRDDLRTGAAAILRRTTAASNRVVSVTARATSAFDSLTLGPGIRWIQEGPTVLTRQWAVQENSEWILPATTTLRLTNGVTPPISIVGLGNGSLAGTVIKEGIGTADVSLAVTNTGLIEIRGGTLRSSRQLLLADGEIRLAGGQLELSIDSIARTPPLLLAGGTLTGAGSITFVGSFAGQTLTNMGSVIRPGQPIGVLRVDPHFSQWPGGTLEIEIAGPGAGSGHDQLAAAARARMQGTLRLLLRGGFVPAVGQEFDIVTGTSIGGDRFNTVEGAAIAPDRHFDIVYQQTKIVARCVAGP